MARGRRRPKKTSRPLSSQSLSSLELPELGALVGDGLYNRVMQWDDSGAAQALLAAEERRLAKERRNPFWVPKLRSDLYVDSVEWDQEKGTGHEKYPQDAEFELVESVSCACSDGVTLGEDFTLDVPVLAEAILEESSNGVLLMVGGQPVQPSGWGENFEQEQSVSSACNDGVDTLGKVFPVLEGPILTDAVLENSSNGVILMVGGQPVQPSGWGEDIEGEESVSCASMKGDGLRKVFPAPDGPILVEAVLEESANGVILMVGGQQVEPSGWGEAEVEAQMHRNVDEPMLVEAVLEDFEDGQRLLVGGWPVKPSWDQLEIDWAYLGCQHTCGYYGCSDGELCSGENMSQSMGTSTQITRLKPLWHNSLHQKPFNDFMVKQHNLICSHNTILMEGLAT